MDSPDEGRDGLDPEVRARGPEVVVAAFLLALAVMVVLDSVRAGTGWGDDGPRSGYFPFYIGLLLAASSLWILVEQLWHWRGDRTVFAGRAQVAMVVSVFVPMVVYVGLIFVLGIYVSSALLIGYFMTRYGKYRPQVTLPVALGVPLAVFLVFEWWFLVLLPKGPLERLFGL